MSAEHDGGPAFPQSRVWNAQRAEYEDTAQYPGMSLRDWFAGQALAGIMAQSHGGPKDWTKAGHGWGEDALNSLNKHETYYPHTLSRFAYDIADAMLAASATPDQQRTK